MSNLQDRLYNHHETPPSHTWDKIASALDEAEMENQFPKTLYAIEATPPAAAWERIQESLHPPVVSMPARTVKMPILRYAIAALFIGAIAFGVFRLTRNTTSLPPDIVAKSGEVVPKTNVPSDALNTTPVTPTAIEPGSEHTLKDKRLIAQNTTPARSNRREASSRSTDATNALYTYQDRVPNVADRYIMLMTPDGNFIRMSKKWSNMVCCVSGEEQDSDCKDQIKKWQEKLAQSPVSSDNVMDILSLVNSLDESGGDL